MLVRLRNNWFAPNNRLYRKTTREGEVREVPDEFRDRLPTTAKIVRAGDVATQYVEEDDDPVPEATATTTALEEHDRVVNKAEEFHEQLIAERKKKAAQDRMAKARAAKKAKQATA